MKIWNYQAYRAWKSKVQIDREGVMVKIAVFSEMSPNLFLMNDWIKQIIRSNPTVGEN